MSKYNPLTDPCFFLIQRIKKAIGELEQYVDDYREIAGNLGESSALHSILSSVDLSDVPQKVIDQKLDYAFSRLSNDSTCTEISQ